jgi:hypothetical protein
MRTTPITLAMAAAGLLVAGCGDDDDSGDSAASAKPATLTIVAKQSGARGATYTVPSELRGGTVRITLRNASRGPREAQLVRVDGDRSAADVLRVIDAENPKIPSWLHAEGGPASALPGQTRVATLRLTPGTYYVTDTGDEDAKTDPATFARLRVAGDGSSAALPEAPARIVARDYSLQATGLKPGRNEVRFTNEGDELHHAIFLPMRDGASLAEVTKFLTTDGEGAQGPPPVAFSAGAGDNTTVLDRDGDQVTTLTLRAGRYAAVCFLSDRGGGPPHVAKGMIDEVRVG